MSYNFSQNNDIYGNKSYQSTNLKITADQSKIMVQLDHKAVSDIVNNKFKVFSNIPCDFNWIVFGKKQDIEIEPLKGNGPYLYL